MKIKIANPQRELSFLKNLDQNFLNLLYSGNYIGGKSVENFESRLSKFLDTKYIASVNSGTDALFLALIALDIKENDEVIVPSFTYFATVETILNLKAIPVFVDIELDKFTISLNTLEKAVTKKTKCIIPVHLFGFNSDIENIVNFAKNKNISVLEDTAQAFGSKTLDEKYLGTLGDINAFSTYPTKTLGGIGDGGFITTNNKELYKKVKLLKNHGQSKTYFHDIPGYNSRLDSLNAYILTKKLGNFSAVKKSRTEFFKDYIKFFDKYSDIEIPKIEKNNLLNNFSIKVSPKLRGALLKELNLNNIEAKIYYPIPVHQQKALSSLTLLKNSKNLINTEKLSKKIISLPFYAFPTLDEKDFIFNKLEKVFKKLGIN